MLRFRRQIQELREQAQSLRSQRDLSANYATDPVGYARDILGVSWWAKQVEIVESLLRPPHKVLVKASHKVGKTHVIAGLVNWFYDSFRPSACLTTAPTKEHVEDVLWREIRLQRRGRPGFTGPQAASLEDAPDHYAKGITTSSGEAFQGRHQERMFFAFDEAVAVKPVYWETVRSMFKPGGKHLWVAICNPTSAASQFYAEEQSGEWTVISIDARDHPNVSAELAGQPPPFPGAVSAAQVDMWVRAWCRSIPAEDAVATDFQWAGSWWQPGPLAECRMLGRWPSSTSGVWSDALFTLAETTDLAWSRGDVPEIGCDPARFGDDYTAIHVRWGPVSVHHERANGWSTARTAGRLKQLADEWAGKWNLQREEGRPEMAGTETPVKVDVDGLGAGVVDQAGEYRFIPVSAAAAARSAARFPNTRSELWFNAMWMAAAGNLSLARLPRDARLKLRVQALSPLWIVDPAGRVVVERKEQIKSRLGFSPDDMDALNLAYWPACGFTAPEPVPDPETSEIDGSRGRSMFGR